MSVQLYRPDRLDDQLAALIHPHSAGGGGVAIVRVGNDAKTSGVDRVPAIEANGVVLDNEPILNSWIGPLVQPSCPAAPGNEVPSQAKFPSGWRP